MFSEDPSCDSTRRFEARAGKWREVWGSGRGPLARLAPETRILAGATLLSACLIAPATTLTGFALIVAGVAAWTAACLPPPRLAKGAVFFRLVLFLPYFLLIPILPREAAEAAPGPLGPLAVPWSILVHGLSGMLVSVWTAAVLAPSDLREGLARLPVPRIVSAIALQIVHQTGALFDEAGRVASAIAVRGASGRAFAAWRILWSLPRVWLPRILGRGERVANAMEVRGFGAESLRPLQAIRLGFGDYLALILSFAFLGLALGGRVWGMP